MRRRTILLMLATLSLPPLALGAYGLEKTEFVAKCMANGREYKPCACTYSALPELPDAYADLAVRWAHQPHDNYTIDYLKVVAKDLMPVGGGRTTRYGKTQDQLAPSYFTRLVKSVGTSVAVKWIISLVPGIDGGASLLVTSATKVTGRLGYAQYIFDRHCGKRLQTAFTQINDLTDAATSAAKSATETTINAISRTIGLGTD